MGIVNGLLSLGQRLVQTLGLIGGLAMIGYARPCIS